VRPVSRLEGADLWNGYLKATARSRLARIVVEKDILCFSLDLFSTSLLDCTVTRGMQAALPFISVFAPAHDFASLSARERHLVL
jgi:hypothetical protein